LYPLSYLSAEPGSGMNKLRIPISEEKTLKFDRKYKSLLLATDSWENIMFPNIGAVLERIKVYRDDSFSLVVPFLKKGPED
jgi:hypothetical protein